MLMRQIQTRLTVNDAVAIVFLGSRIVTALSSYAVVMVNI
jgi:hypothetical protein